MRRARFPRIAAMLLLLLLLAPGLGANPGIIDKQVYDIGEQVLISAPSITRSLVIKSPAAEYKLIDPPQGTQRFSPQEAGQHTVTLYDQDGKLLVTAEFLVREPPAASSYQVHIDPLEPRVGNDIMLRISPMPAGEVDVVITAPGGKFKYYGLWQDASFVARSPGQHIVTFASGGTVIAERAFEVLDAQERLISTAKQDYAAGEPIVITAGSGIGTAWSLIIISGSQSSKYYGTQQTVEFLPLESGKQVIQAVSVEGKLLEELVVEATAAEMPVANSGFLIEDHQGRQRPVQSVIIQTLHGAEVEVLEPATAITSIRFRGLERSLLQRLRVEDVPAKAVYGQPALRSYAIDPTMLNFTNATVSAVAQGTSLYKCKEYDYTSQTCWGSWEKVRDLTPGEEYRFLLTPEDPLYSELNSSYSCSCADADTNSNSGDLTCGVYCSHTINIPVNATSFFLQRMNYTLTITITNDGTTISNSNQYGFYDHDQDHTDADDAVIGSATNTATTTFTIVNGSVASSGARSFTNLDCSNWPNYCIYNVYINASLHYQAPGQSRKNPSMNISVSSINYTLNYTVPGPFSVTLNSPSSGTYSNSSTVRFGFTPIDQNAALTNCSLYTNETAWNGKNATTSPVNNSINYLNVTFSSDGTYLWNAYCNDTANSTAYAPTNYTIIVDTTPPIPRQRTPADGGTETANNVVTFTYNVSDASPITNCSLYINGNRVKDDLAVAKDADETINHNLLNGLYNWSVGCYDIAGNFNTTGNRTLNVSVPISILSGLWYETDTANCNTSPCQIDARQATDGTLNTISGTINPSQTVQWVNATSTFIGSNGGVINSGSSVTFSSFFSASAGNINAYWYLYRMLENGTTSLVCSNTGGTATAGGAASTGTCTLASTIQMLATDRFLYRIDLGNSHPSQTRTFTHDIDHSSSFFNVTNFTQLGTLTATQEPTANMTLLQGDSFMLNCSAACIGGSCISTNVYAQINTSGAWTNVGAAGVLVLSSGETNPHSLGTIFNTTSNTSFNLSGSTVGTTYVRCSAQTPYATANSTPARVQVMNNQAPTIALNTPGNDTWQNRTTINLTYTPTSGGTFANCSLYLDGAFNQTNQTPISNGAANRFTVTLTETRHNWSVTCSDTGGLTNSSATWYVDIDAQQPYNITLNFPDNATDLTNPYIDFNWTAEDLRSPNMSCQLVINDTVNTTRTVLNATPFNVTVGMFSIGSYRWYVNCTDLAGSKNQSETRYFTVSDEPPRVKLLTPPNNTGVNTTAVVFTYNASDNYQLMGCSLYINGVFNQTNQTGLVNGTNNFTATLAQGLYNWSVRCTDDANLNTSTGNFSVRVDLVYPNVTQISPPNATLVNGTSVTFTYNASDDNSVLACRIYVDDILSINSTPVSGVPKNESGTGYPDGNHWWNVSCSDIANNTNTTGKWDFTVNMTPQISQDSPPDGAHRRFNMTLLYTPSDNDGFANCSLYLNGAFNQTNSTQLNSTVQANFTLIDPAEGYYNWSVACVDNGSFSNRNETLNRTFVVDNTPPNITLQDPANGSLANISAVWFSWTATDAYATAMACNLTLNGTVNQTGIISVNGNVTNTSISGIRTGNYTWSVTCADNATNVNTSVTNSFEVVLLPKVNLTAPPNNTWDMFSTVNFTYLPYEGSGTFPSCTLIINGADNETDNTITPDTENTFTLTLADGRYDWNVRCVDSNNFTATGENRTRYVDTAAPYNVSLINPGNGSTVIRNNVSFTFVEYDLLSPNATCEITLDDGTGPYLFAWGLNATNATDYTHYDVLPDGNYSWNVTCFDYAGWPNSSVTWNFTIEAPPNVTLQAPADFAWNNTGNMTFTYVPDDDILIKNCTLYIDGAVNQTDAIILNKQPNEFTLNSMPSGIYNWTVGCFDSDDNYFEPANRTLYIDLVMPYIAQNGPGPAATLQSSNVVFNWTADDNLAYNLTCDLTINATVNQSGMVVQNGVAYTSPVNGFTDGLFLWNVTCADQALNMNTSLTRNFTIAEPPTVMLHTPANLTRTRNTTLDFIYTPDDNSGSVAGCSLILNDAANASNGTPVTIETQNNITATDLVDNTYLWTVNCTDRAGNQGTNSTPYTLYVDLLGPYITPIHPAQNQTFNLNNITFNWTAVDFAGTNIACNLSVTNASGTVNVTGIVNVSNSTFFARVDNLEDGGHNWTVSCADDLGNTNTSQLMQFAINQPDFLLNDSGILFNDTNPDAGATINITANVSNIGGIGVVANTTFWDGAPESGGVYLGSMSVLVPYNGSALFWTLWNITDGYHAIHVRVDPENAVRELNETNNNASRNLSYIKINITAPQNNTYTNDTTPEIHFNITDFTANNVNYTIRVDGVPNGQSGSVAPGSNTTLNLSALSDGIRSVVVRATDYLGRVKDSVPLVLRIDTTAPSTAFVTQNRTYFNSTAVTISFNITDLLSSTINYTVYVDGTMNRSNTTTNGTQLNESFTLAEGAHTIVVEATDEVYNTANSTTLTVYVDLTAPEVNITTANNTWFNTSSPSIGFNITDNLDPVLNYTVYVDGVQNVNGSANNATGGNATLSGIGEGTHTIIISSYDDAGNVRNSTPITIHVDLTIPYVGLISPANDSNHTTTSVTLNFTASDNMAGVLACDLRLDGIVVQQYNLTNATYGTYDAVNLGGGYHYWNITCSDDAANRNVSATWRFYILLPDLTITSLSFNSSAPVENETVLVNATVSNTGERNVTSNITVEFWLGDPSLGGTLLSNQTLAGLSIGENITLNTTLQAIIGLNQIFVIIDPPLATNGSHEELNESNNMMNLDFWVGLYEVFAGGSINELRISDASIVAAFSWNQSETTGSNVFVADSESAIAFTSLHAIGLNTTNGTAVGTDDFEEIDARMNTTSLNDSVNLTWKSGGVPLGYRNITAYKRSIIQVPVINSTNTSSFTTGILWDASDGGTRYNGTQDVVFITAMNQSMAGQYGTYDYEIKVPAKLRDYIAGGGTVTFYTELR